MFLTVHPFLSLLLVSFGLGSFAVPSHENVKRQGRTTPLLTVFPGQAALPTLADIINLNATNGTYLPIQNIQGDTLVGMKKAQEIFYFFHINDAPAFKSTMQSYISNITSVATLLSDPSAQPLAFVNVALSYSGLATLGIPDDIGDSQFSAGQFADAANLGDDVSQWETAFKGTNIHGVFLIGSDQSAYTTQYASDITSIFGSSITQVYQIDAAARPGSEAGHEHFGYLDGISNPAVMGFATTVLPGQTIVAPGTILCNRLGDLALRSLWALDGTFMAFRKLQQKVPEFDQWTLDNAVQDPSLNLTQQEGAQLLGARMFGRWPSGAPIDITPYADDPELGADPERNNNFDFSHLGSSLASDQSRCPFSAHIRKTNPRADLLDLDTINHAIRAGIPYGPEVTPAESSSSTTTEDRGFAFVEYQSDIANGFRFQQITWANTANFPPLKTVTPGIEPIIGQGGGKIASGLNPNDQVETYAVPDFVVPKGGEYFFVPSISTLSEVFVA
ncbi:hypothetical protein NM688_g2124 [Phlebia brevispora]|uniref:Uncharacterized protein n=1 Tax=Phlebia brevispora TaxID=194682 RepID=A0ACC1T9J8_9APHY|nr:hypothetical protein NM688_g2124 [Phlebia brevispora]